MPPGTALPNAAPPAPRLCPLLLSAGGAISHPYLPASPAEMPSFTRGLVVFPSFPQGFRAKREKGFFLPSPLSIDFLYVGKLWFLLAVGLRWQKTPHKQGSEPPPLQVLQSCTWHTAWHGWITAQMGSLAPPDRSTTAPSPLPLNGKQLFPPKKYKEPRHHCWRPCMVWVGGCRRGGNLSSTAGRPAQHV